VAVLDEGIRSKLSKRLGGKSVVCFPDITEEECSDSPTAIENELQNRTKGRRVVGLLGSLDKRKGLLDFVRHVAVMKNDPICFLIAGEVIEHSFSEEENRVISNFMANPPENAFTYRGFIGDGVPFNRLVRACDLLYAVYHGFPHSSNMLTKAACMNVPVVVSDQYLMAERVKRFNLGFTIRENSPEDFQSLITSGKAFALQSEERFERGCLDYMKEHSFDRLVISFQELLEG
jgi:glycosyltransferase involved in cell wall biosynthesis